MMVDWHQCRESRAVRGVEVRKGLDMTFGSCEELDCPNSWGIYGVMCCVKGQICPELISIVSFMSSDGLSSYMRYYIGRDAHGCVMLQDVSLQKQHLQRTRVVIPTFQLPQNIVALIRPFRVAFYYRTGSECNASPKLVDQTGY